MRVGTPSFDLSALWGLFGPRADVSRAPQREPVQQVPRQFRFTDAFESKDPRLQSWLLGADFKRAQQANVEGTSPRAQKAKEVEATFRSYWGDGFEAARAPKVDLGRPAMAAQAPERAAAATALPATDFLPQLADLG